MQEWEIAPKKGLGRIEFGMTIDDVAQIGDIYGERTDLVEQEDGASALRKVLEEDAGNFSDEDKKAILEVIEETANSSPAITRERKSSGLMLDYVNNSLVEILCTEHFDKLSVDGISIFEERPLTVVEALSKKFSETPVILGNRVAFRDNYLYLFDFLRIGESDDDLAEILKGESGDKSVLWRDTPQNPAENFSSYRRLDFSRHQSK